MQIALGLEQAKVHLLKDVLEATGVKSSWLHVSARPDFVEPSDIYPISIKNDVSSKITFAQDFNDEPGSNVMSYFVLNFNGPVLAVLLQDPFSAHLAAHASCQNVALRTHPCLQAHLARVHEGAGLRCWFPLVPLHLRPLQPGMGRKEKFVCTTKDTQLHKTNEWHGCNDHPPEPGCQSLSWNAGGPVLAVPLQDPFQPVLPAKMLP